MNEEKLYNSPFVASNIKKYAKKKNISLKNILSECGLGSNTFSHMLHGKSIAFDSLARIADYLNCSVDYLLGRTDEQTQVSSSDLSAHELKLIYAYRINPQMQQAVDTLLGVAEDDEIHIVKRAARSGVVETDSSLTTDETLLIQHGERLKPSDDV